MKNLVFWLNFFEKDFSFLTFNFNYFEDVVFREFAFKNGNVCFLHFKKALELKQSLRFLMIKVCINTLNISQKFQSIIMIQKNILQKD